jgi:hypothetical protein
LNLTFPFRRAGHFSVKLKAPKCRAAFKQLVRGLRKPSAGFDRQNCHAEQSRSQLKVGVLTSTFFGKD